MSTIITEPTNSAPDTVERHVAFKFCLNPTKAQLRALARDGGASRATYNMLVGYNADVMRNCNEYWGKRREEGASDDEIKAELKTLAKEDPRYKILGYMAYGKVLTAEGARHRACAKAIEEGAPVEEVWGADERSKEPWLHTINRRVLVSGTQSADKALKNFFDSRTGKRAGGKMGAPKFKSRAENSDSFTIPAPDTMGGYGTAYLRGEPAYKHAKETMKRRGEKGNPVISDYRHVRLAHLGTMRIHGNTRWLKRTEKRITKLQQKIARQVKGSNRRKATVRKLAKTHHLVALRRETGLHQLTKNLTTRYALIGIEDLNVTGMTASASGTIEKPGKNVAQKAGLNRAVLDVSFGAFRTQLEYKAAWYGSAVQVIDRYYPSSQTCSNCGKRPETKLTLSDRVYKCEHCHAEIDRDLNAAINIRREAERLYAEA